MQLCCVNYIRIIPKITCLPFNVYMFLSSLNYGFKKYLREKIEQWVFLGPRDTQICLACVYLNIFPIIFYPFELAVYPFTRLSVVLYTLYFEGDNPWTTELEMEGDSNNNNKKQQKKKKRWKGKGPEGPSSQASPSPKQESPWQNPLTSGPSEMHPFLEWTMAAAERLLANTA